MVNLKNFAVGALSVLALDTLNAPGAHAVSITNANFEASSSMSEGDVPGFTVGQGFAVITDGGSSYNQVLELNVYQNDASNPQPFVYQTLGSPLASGNYTFTADVSSPFNFKGYDGGFSVSFTDLPLDTTLGSGTFTPTDSEWKKLSFSVFVPGNTPANSIDLYITHTGVGDAEIDNLLLSSNLSAVPLPASWSLMIGGLSLLGGGMKLRQAMRRRITGEFAT